MTRITRTGQFSLLVAAALREAGNASTAVEIGSGTITLNITDALDFGPRSRPHISTPRRKAQWKSETRGRRS